MRTPPLTRLPQLNRQVFCFECGLPALAQDKSDKQSQKLFLVEVQDDRFLESSALHGHIREVLAPDLTGLRRPDVLSVLSRREQLAPRRLLPQEPLDAFLDPIVEHHADILQLVMQHIGLPLAPVEVRKHRDHQRRVFQRRLGQHPPGAFPSLDPAG